MNNGEFILWIVLSILIIGAVAGEYKSSRDMTNANRIAETECNNETTTTCNSVARALNTNRLMESKTLVQWRRAIIASTSLYILIEILLQNPIRTPSRSLIFIALTFVSIISINGYNDYHMQLPSQDAINNCMHRAILDLSNETPENCDLSIMGQLPI
jgi:hypothetical protein